MIFFTVQDYYVVVDYLPQAVHYIPVIYFIIFNERYGGDTGS